MLKHLHIRNYALIRELDIDFGAGFSVLTGETGAGKSIILGALGLAMGAKADTKTISEGADLCVIEAEFQDKENYLIRRELHAGGRSRSFVNDEVVSQADLKALSAKLIDIHSQHQNLLIGDDTFQLGIVDAVAMNQAEREAYATGYAEYVSVVEELKQLKSLANKTKADADYIAFQYSQLEEAHLAEGEQEELETEEYRLEHAEEIGNNLQNAIRAIDDEDGVLQRLRSIRLQDADSTLQERIESAYIELKDILSETESLLDKTEVNPQRLAEVQERLDLLYTLERKHGVKTVEELIAIREQLHEQMDNIDGFEERISALEKKVATCRTQCVSLAKKLTSTRTAVCKRISEYLIESLHSLGVKHANADIAIAALPDLTESGADDVQILFAANLGQSLRPVSEVASGGEISRVMLSLKALVASTTGLPTILFDEIDTGVSGDIATQMGKIMHDMADSRQIIAISHLPQIAVQGDTQYRVYKHDVDDHTETHILRMTDNERQEYINNYYATIGRALASKDA